MMKSLPGHSFILIPLILVLGSAVVIGLEVSDSGPKRSTLQANPAGDRPITADEKPQGVEDLLLQLNKAQQEARWNDAEQVLSKLLSIEPNLKDDLRATAITIHLNRSLEEKKWDAAEKHLDDLVGIEPQAQAALLAIRIQILFEKGETNQACMLARNALAGEKDLCRLNSISRALLSKASPGSEVIKLAHELALAANSGECGCRTGHLWVLARAEFLRGHPSKAIEVAGKALRRTDDPEERRRIQKELDSYNSGKLPTSN